MTSIGIFFGTDTGRTRLIAKQIAKKLGDVAAAPDNIGRATLEEIQAEGCLVAAALSATSWRSASTKVASDLPGVVLHG